MANNKNTKLTANNKVVSPPPKPERKKDKVNLREKVIKKTPPKQEPVEHKPFVLTREVWENILSDSNEYDMRKEYITLPYIEKKYNVAKNVANNIKFALDYKDIIHSDLKNSILNKNIEIKFKENEKRLKDYIHQYELLEKKYEFALGIGNEMSSYTMSKIQNKNFKLHDAVAFGILSDVHIEEKVELEITDGLNEYTPEIAKKRLENFFVNLLKMVNKERQSVNINQLVLGLLGDFITGYIHEELKESNYMSPTEATRYVQNILIDGITYLVDNGNFKKIIIPCTRGNHGRTTAKKRFSTGADNSFEWMMYKNIENYFFSLSKREDKFKILTFIIPKSELVHINVYDKVVRFGHGDHFKYAGGIGGITIPLKKWLSRQNEQRKADMTFIGHWHNILTEVTEDCMVNGSIIGVNGYSMSFGGTPRPPQQIFTLLDEKRGFSIRGHIDVI